MSGNVTPLLIKFKKIFSKYTGTTMFALGFFLCLFAAILLSIYRVSLYNPQKLIILNYTATVSGIGLLLIIIGLNIISGLSNKKIYLITFAIGVVFSIAAIGIFYINYPQNWYYPLISYTSISYVIGILILLANIFFIITSKTRLTEVTEVPESERFKDLNYELMKKSKIVDNLIEELKGLHLDNLQKNFEGYGAGIIRERKNHIKMYKNVLDRILKPVDDCEIYLNYLRSLKDESVSEKEIVNEINRIESINIQLQHILIDEKVEQIIPDEGEIFDDRYHKISDTQPDFTVESDDSLLKIKKVVKKGYKQLKRDLEEDILRFAEVEVEEYRKDGSI
ncbi:MAG: nucleotide exchange factor GrpE [Candidatus Methanoperedenaceae archaeon]|nr:nucleotide exchange factor GrpE [Candidatus Methanoperedenaceae archaeon]